MEVVETAEVDDSLRVVAVADGEEGSVVGFGSQGMEEGRIEENSEEKVVAVVRTVDEG